MFKKRWAVVVLWNDELDSTYYRKKEAQYVVDRFNSMAARTGYEVRFVVKDLKKGCKNGK